MNLPSRLFFKPSLGFAVFASLLGCLGSSPASAERADKAMPMNIEADALRYDDLKQISVFTGRVVVSKGSIVLRGARLEVRQDPEGYQFGVVTGEPGHRAFFRQKREGLEEYVEGEGETIEYNGRSDNVTFVHQAEMRRLVGSVVSDRVGGDVIFYDNQTDMFTVDGVGKKAATTRPSASGATGKGEAGNSDNGRVRAMLSPRSSDNPGKAQTNRAPGVAPDLKPSVNLSTVTPGDKP
jgi:lipopolysaccharide export system protein LptA